MKPVIVIVAIVAAAGACRRAAEIPAAEIIALERAALDRWGRGDPAGYLAIMAPDISYFDPTQSARLDGRRAMTDLLVPLTGKIRIDRYEMLNPKVQPYGDAALLTFNLVSYRKQADGTERAIVRWNSTEAYARHDGRWVLVHSHWSYVKPDVKQVPEFEDLMKDAGDTRAPAPR
jgi:ketosteroid isomerase-like protein